MRLNFTQICARMLEAGNLKNITEMAGILCVTPQAISNYKKRGDMPARLIFRFAEIYGVSLDWILTGEGEKFRAAKAPEGVCSAATVEPDKSGQDSSEAIDTEAVNTADCGSLTPDEMIYIGKLLKLLRCSEKHVVLILKAGIDAALQKEVHT